MTRSSHLDTYIADPRYRWTCAGHDTAHSNDDVASPKRHRLLELICAIVAHITTSARINRADWPSQALPSIVAARAAIPKSP